MGHGKGNLCKKGIALFLLASIVATIVAVCVVYIPKHHHDKGAGKPDDPSSNSSSDDDSDDDIPSEGLNLKVTNKAAFVNGGASDNPSKKDNGVGAGKDEYTLYTGKWDKFPKMDDWVSFEDMWNINKNETIKTSCKDHGWGENNSDDETQYIYDAIQALAKNSDVDNRFILAIVLQESKGCVRVHSTNNGVHNPGLMQSHNGTSYDPDDSKKSIQNMIQDGTQGTPDGKGLVQYLNEYPDAYSAARGYNSGAVAENGDLSDAIGATPCYASDVANRLTGWVKADPKCGNEASEDGLTSPSSTATATAEQWKPSATAASSSSSDGQWHASSAASSGQWVPDTGAASGQWQG